MSEKKKPMSIRDVGKKGGQSTFKKHGSDHYRKIAIEGWKKRREKAKQN